ncbi:MAG TPA: hypothetical protein VMW41_00155 [Candidatus Bathyarchaeia archaeon]|nr:hypothetical protein [Candidatus Bathyarchaeia archaeon]
MSGEVPKGRPISRREFLRIAALAAAGAALAGCAPKSPGPEAPTQVPATETSPKEQPTVGSTEVPVATETLQPDLNIFATPGEVFAGGGESGAPLSILRVPEYLVSQALGATQDLPPGTNTIEFFVDPAGQTISIEPSQGSQQVGTFPREFGINGAEFVWDATKGCYETADGQQATIDLTFTNPEGFSFPSGVLAKLSGSNEAGESFEEWRVILLDAQDTSGDGSVDSVERAWCGEISHNPEVRPAILDRVAYREFVTANVMGFEFLGELVTGQSLVDRESWAKIKRVTLVGADARQRFAELVMLAQFKGWQEDKIESRKDVTFDQYMEKIVRGDDDVSYEVMAINPQISAEPQKTKIDPRAQTEVIFTDRSLPIKYARQNTANEISYGIAVDAKGKTHILCRLASEDQGDFQEHLSKYPQQDMVDYYFSFRPSDQLLMALEMLGTSNDFQMYGNHDAESQAKTPGIGTEPDMEKFVSDYYSKGDENCWTGIIRVEADLESSSSQ